MSVKAAARVQITLEIDIPSAWGETCDLKQVFDQAGRAALDRINLFIEGGRKSGVNVAIVSAPRVTAILVDGER